jgi:hypothetical protein
MHRSLLLLLLLALLPLAAAESSGSVNISHPLVASVSATQLSYPMVYDVEIGLGGAKVGAGIGLLKMGNNGRGGGLAVKAVLMRTWESPIDSFWEDTSFYEENYFAPNNWYAGIEGVISPLPYRLALGAYKLMGDVDDLDDTARDFDIGADDIIWGASLGMGF